MLFALFKNFFIFFFSIGLLLSCQKSYYDNPNSQLIYAVKNNNSDLVKIAIARGADLNFKDDKGRTALHWAAYYGNLEIAKILIMHGASLFIKDDNGLTPLDIAKMNNKTKFLSQINKFRKGGLNDKSNFNGY